MLLELGVDERQREPGADQRDVAALAQQVGHAADVVLVAVGEHDGDDVVQPVPDRGEVGEDHVDPRLVLLGEQDAAVDDQQLAACSNTVMLRPISPRPPRAITRSPPGASGRGCAVRDGRDSWPERYGGGCAVPPAALDTLVGGSGVAVARTTHRRMAVSQMTRPHRMRSSTSSSRMRASRVGIAASSAPAPRGRAADRAARSRRSPSGCSSRFAEAAAQVALDQHPLAEVAHLVVDDAGDALQVTEPVARDALGMADIAAAVAHQDLGSV